MNVKEVNKLIFKLKSEKVITVGTKSENDYIVDYLKPEFVVESKKKGNKYELKIKD